MGQPNRTATATFFVLICGVLWLAGCGEKTRPIPSSQPTADHHTTVVSLVPAATDLIVTMGASDHLVAVSNYDPTEIGSRTLLRVGDYAGPDWETLAMLRPQVMIIQMDPSRLPDGFLQKADHLGITLVNLRLNTINDVLAAIPQLGRAIGEPDQATALAKDLFARLEALRVKSAALPKVRTLLTLGETAETLVGTGTFLDDLLVIAGGENAAASLGSAWPTADTETLIGLKPQAVIVLKSSATAAVLDRAIERWAKMPEIPAVKLQRIYLIKNSRALLPGAHVAEVAEEMFRDLHPEAAK